MRHVPIFGSARCVPPLRGCANAWHQRTFPGSLACKPWSLYATESCEEAEGSIRSGSWYGTLVSMCVFLKGFFVCQVLLWRGWWGAITLKKLLWDPMQRKSGCSACAHILTSCIFMYTATLVSQEYREEGSFIRWFHFRNRACVTSPEWCDHARFRKPKRRVRNFATPTLSRTVPGRILENLRKVSLQNSISYSKKEFRLWNSFGSFANQCCNQK